MQRVSAGQSKNRSRNSAIALATKLLLLLVWCANAQPRAELSEHVARERTYDVLHYKLVISVDERAKSVSGDVAITLVPLRPRLSEIALDAAGLTIRQVALGKSRLQFVNEGERLRIALDKPARLTDTLTLVVSYSASPKKGLYFIRPDSGYPNRPWQVWSQGQAEDNHFWFPCYDYPNDFATSEMMVTVNERFTAISNGALVKTTHNASNRTKTYHWRESKPHVSYLVSLVVGEYVELRESVPSGKDSWDVRMSECPNGLLRRIPSEDSPKESLRTFGGIPILYYVYPHQKDLAKYSFSKTSTMVKFFSEKIGFRYPWEKYAQTVVADFIYGGMENVSASTLTDFTIHGERAHLDVSSDGLVAHELAHQWWGNLLTCRDWSHAWLNEGFATYFTYAFQEADSGFHYAAYNLLGTQNNIVGSDIGSARRPTVTNRFADPSDIFDSRIYGKGACILHMLRFVLGDELFWKAINHYITKHAFDNVETNDFKIAIEEATGYNPHWFFKQWVYQAGYPEFVVTTQWDSVNHTLGMTVQQVQRLEEYMINDSLGGLFTMPVDVEIWSEGKVRVERIRVSRHEEEFQFPQHERPQLIIFDKGNWILKTVSFQKSVEEWLYQLEHADGIDKVLAARELSNYVDQPMVIQALHRALLHDAFWSVRVEAARSLAQSDDSTAADALADGYRDGHTRVREAVIAALGNFNGPNVVETLQLAFTADMSYAVATAALRSLVQADHTNARTYCEEALQRSSHNEIMKSAALRAIADFADDEALKILKDHTRYGVYRDLRIAAIQSLARVWASEEKVAALLIPLLDDPSFHVRRAVIEALGQIHSITALEPLRRKASEEPDSRMRKAARDAIEKIQQSQAATN